MGYLNSHGAALHEVWPGGMRTVAHARQAALKPGLSCFDRPAGCIQSIVKHIQCIPGRPLNYRSIVLVLCGVVHDQESPQHRLTRLSHPGISPFCLMPHLLSLIYWTSLWTSVPAEEACLS